MEYIKFLFGEDISEKASELKKDDQFTLPNTKTENDDLRIETQEMKISKDNEEKLHVKIDKVDITLLKPIDFETMKMLKSLLTLPPHLFIEIVSLSISTLEALPKEKRCMPFTNVVNTASIHRASSPMGHSYPSEEEWGIVFKCPFYQTFPSSKALPIVIMEAEVQVSLKDKKPQSLHCYLLPLYIVFYESQNSSKAVDSIFLTGAKIEVDSSHQFSLVKSGEKVSMAFGNVQTMQQWSQATLRMINEASSSLERWRKDNLT